jgi:hypothetical protein
MGTISIDPKIQLYQAINLKKERGEVLRLSLLGEATMFI